MRQQTRRPAHGRISTVSERAEYRLLVALAFTLCLVTVVCRRMFAAAPAGHGGRESVFAEAYSTAMAAIGYAFIA